MRYIKSKIAAIVLLPVTGILGNAAVTRYIDPRNVSAQEDQTASVSLRVRLLEQTLDFQQGGNVLKTYIVSGGRGGYPTPKGTFRVQKVVWNPTWSPPDSRWARGRSATGPDHPRNPMKLVKIFFKEPDYYIHGTDQLDQLGEAASHGCLRMDPIEAGELAVRVMQAGGVQHATSWYQTAVTKGETRTVTLPRPVTIVITD
ncbi:MAG TPA: L,D-transpeptidase [Gemmatimonadaceae bacterium]